MPPPSQYLEIQATRIYSVVRKLLPVVTGVGVLLGVGGLPGRPHLLLVLGQQLLLHRVWGGRVRVRVLGILCIGHVFNFVIWEIPSSTIS